MDTTELLRRVRSIEIKTSRLSNNVFAGEYHSAFKGRGMSFAEVREYQPGDDVRDIDWNVTARTGRPHVKIFEEERELTLMLLVDISGSLDFGTHTRTARELSTEIAATLAFSALKNNDKIGIIFFSDRVEKYIPPKKGRRHVLYLIRELLTFEPQSRKTNVACALEYLMRVQRRRCIGFLLSDFVESGDFSQPLAISARKHDLVAVRLYDRRLEALPDVGLLKIIDAESGTEAYIDTSSKAFRQRMTGEWCRRQAELDTIFRKSGVDNALVETAADFVQPLVGLFQRR
ncbi:MAG: DUF58 domain-containing protein [Alloprevotella sp.]